MNTDVLTPPEDLPDAAREKWAALAAQLAERCGDTPPELLRDQMRMYCIAFALAQHALAQLARGGSLLATNLNGMQYVHPLLKVVAEANRDMDRVFRRLGFGGRTADTAPEGIEL